MASHPHDHTPASQNVYPQAQPPHPPNNFPAPPRPPNAQGPPARAPRRDVAARHARNLAEYMLREEVQVRIRANVWVVGVLVSTLQFFQKFMGLGYEIEFRPVPDGPTHTDVYPRDDVRPLNRKTI